MLRKAQEVMATQTNRMGVVEMVWHRYVPTDAGVEQYINGQLRAQIPGDAWGAFCEDVGGAMSAQAKDDAQAEAEIGSQS